MLRVSADVFEILHVLSDSGSYPNPQMNSMQLISLIWKGLDQAFFTDLGKSLCPLYLAYTFMEHGWQQEPFFKLLAWELPHN